MTGQTNIETGAATLRKQYPNIRLLNVTAGSMGSWCFYENNAIHVPAFCLGRTVDTAGAGDTFCVSVLSFVLEHRISKLSTPELTEMLLFANAAAYLVTTRKGAIRSMPEPADVEQILREHPVGKLPEKI